jgi:hypothetical protein
MARCTNIRAKPFSRRTDSRSRFERARELYADQWPGFSEVQLHQWLEQADFRNIEVTVVSREKESLHFQTVFATGSK